MIAEDVAPPKTDDKPMGPDPTALMIFGHWFDHSGLAKHGPLARQVAWQAWEAQQKVIDHKAERLVKCEEAVMNAIDALSQYGDPDFWSGAGWLITNTDTPLARDFITEKGSTVPGKSARLALGSVLVAYGDDEEKATT